MISDPYLWTRFLESDADSNSSVNFIMVSPGLAALDLEHAERALLLDAPLAEPDMESGVLDQVHDLLRLEDAAVEHDPGRDRPTGEHGAIAEVGLLVGEFADPNDVLAHVELGILDGKGESQDVHRARDKRHGNAVDEPAGRDHRVLESRRRNPERVLEVRPGIAQMLLVGELLELGLGERLARHDVEGTRELLEGVLRLALDGGTLGLLDEHCALRLLGEVVHNERGRLDDRDLHRVGLDLRDGDRLEVDLGGAGLLAFALGAKEIRFHRGFGIQFDVLLEERAVSLLGHLLTSNKKPGSKPGYRLMLCL